MVADNFEITKATVQYMAQQARASGLKYKGMILIGDFGDMNAIQPGRVFRGHPAVSDLIEDSAQVPTE